MASYGAEDISQGCGCFPRSRRGHGKRGGNGRPQELDGYDLNNKSPNAGGRDSTLSTIPATDDHEPEFNETSSPIHNLPLLVEVCRKDADVGNNARGSSLKKGDAPCPSNGEGMDSLNTDEINRAKTPTFAQSLKSVKHSQPGIFGDHFTTDSEASIIKKMEKENSAKDNDNKSDALSPTPSEQSLSLSRDFHHLSNQQDQSEKPHAGLQNVQSGVDLPVYMQTDNVKFIPAPPEIASRADSSDNDASFSSRPGELSGSRSGLRASDYANNNQSSCDTTPVASMDPLRKSPRSFNEKLSRMFQIPPKLRKSERKEQQKQHYMAAKDQKNQDRPSSSPNTRVDDITVPSTTQSTQTIESQNEVPEMFSVI